MTDVLGRGVFELVGNAESLEAAFARAESVARKTETTVTQAVQKTNQSAGKLGEGLGGSVPQMQKLDAATERSARQLLRHNAALELSASGAAAFSAALKGADVNALAPLLQRLQSNIDKQQALASSAAQWAQKLNLVGVSAKQANVALAQMPAQITDIVTSLASGQNPLLVLIQQGGQIKDSFGGIGNSLKVMMSFLTPARLALGGLGAVLVALGEAYREGAVETDNYRKAIVLTGNQAGVTIGQLQGMAKAISTATGATQGKAAEVLTQLAASADVAGTNIKALAQASIALERAGGPAAEETAKAFAALADAPTAASLKLTKQTGFLTAALYEQIHALEKQGRESEASSVAQAAAANDAQIKASRLEQGLGTLQKAWRWLGDEAKGAWDKMLDVGRGDSVQQMVEAAAHAIAAKAANARGGSAPRTGLATVYQGEAGNQNFQALNAAAGYEALSAYYQRAGNEAEKAKIKFSQLAETVQLPTKALADQVAQVRNLGEQAGLSAKDISDLESRIRSLSQVNSMSIAAQQAALAAKQTVQAAIADAAAQEAQHAREMGYLTEIGYLTRIGELEVLAAKQAKERAETELAIAKQLPAEQRDPSIKKAQAEIEAADIRLTATKKAAIDKVTEALHKMAMADERAAVAQAELWQADLNKEAEKHRNLINQIALAHDDFAESLKNDAYAFGIETTAAGQNDLQRAITLQRLKSELELRQRIQYIKNLAASGAITGDESKQEIAKVEQEMSARATAAVDKVVRDFETQGAKQISDSLMTALESGFDSAWDYLKKLLKRQVLEVTIRPLVNDISGIISGAITTMQGGTSTNAAYLQAASTASSLYGYGKSAYGWAADKLGYGAAAGASTAAADGGAVGMADWYAGSSAAGSGSSAAGASFGAYAGYAALIYAGIKAAESAYSKGFTGSDQMKGDYIYQGTPEAATTKLFHAIGMSDKWAEILGGSVALNHMFGYSAPQITATGVQGSLAGGDFSGQAFGDITSKAGWVRSLFGSNDKSWTEFKALPEELGRFMRDAASSVFSEAKKFGEALGLPAEALAGVSTDIKVKLTDDIEANKTELAKAFGQYGDDLVKAWADAVKPLATYGESAADTIKRVGAAIVDVNDVLEAMGAAALKASVESGGAALAIENLFGGIDNLRGAASSYIQNYFSKDEQKSLTMASIGRTLSGVGIDQVPTDRAGFRALVESYTSGDKLLTESGQKAFAALMSVADAFASVTEAGRSAADIASERAGLERQLLELQGDTAALRKLERDALDPANQALYDQIQALKDQQTEAEKAAEAIKTANAAWQSMWQSVDANIGKFMTPDERLRYGYTTIANNLQYAGVLTGTPGLPNVLASASLSTVYDFASQFVALSGASTEAKTAVIQAAAGLADLAGTAKDLQRSAIQGQLQDITNTFGDVMGALSDGVLTLADSYRANKAQLQSLKDGLDNLLGTATKTVQQVLGELLTKQSALTSFRASLGDSIEAARLGTLSPAARIAAMKGNESRLYAELATSDDPATVAAKLQRAITDRISYETSLSKSLYDDQIASLTKLRDLSKEIAQFTAQLRIGDLSPLSYAEQLGNAQSLFNTTLAAAQGGDQTAMGNLLGNAQTYLQEAQSYYGGAGTGYAGVFAAVTGALDALGLTGANADPQIQALQALQSSVSDGSQETYDALIQLQSATDGAATRMQSKVDTQIQLAKDQITALGTVVSGQEAQLRQQADIIKDLNLRLDAINAPLTAIADSMVNGTGYIPSLGTGP